jgi:hypothetical protein
MARKGGGRKGSISPSSADDLCPQLVDCEHGSDVEDMIGSFSGSDEDEEAILTFSIARGPRQLKPTTACTSEVTAHT